MEGLDKGWLGFKILLGSGRLLNMKVVNLAFLLGHVSVMNLAKAFVAWAELAHLANMGTWQTSKKWQLNITIKIRVLESNLGF